MTQVDRDGFLAVRNTFPLDHSHGRQPLSRALAARPETLGLLARDPRLRVMDPSSAVFLDTETTGLGTAAGTLVFLVGVGRFMDDAFEVTQYFLPGPGMEPLFLAAVRAGLGDEAFLVSYNGKCFDAPLLEARFTLQRQRVALSRRPHLDLLYAARNLYRARVPDCRLSTIERVILGVERGEEDVPGALIPGIYFDFLHTGAVEQLGRVFYHNLLDVLSLAGLSGSASAAVEGRPECTHPSDHMGAARMLEASGCLREAEAAYRRALMVATGRRRAELMQRLGFLLKRMGEHERAAEAWRALIEAGADPEAIAAVELAKYLEHRVHDYSAAVEVVKGALSQPGARQPGRREALDHRLRRVMRKAAN
ncbi:MAG: hypothetical protein HPY83_17510 [Anaerolineae bacterium]|nr:hypothetical protein [Anaerolineae bacterium]